MKSVERRNYTRSCYCRRGYGGKVKVCGCGPVTETRWVIVENGVTLHGHYSTKREALLALAQESV
jgi:hypothetical protein